MLDDAMLDSDEMLDILLTPPSGLHGELRRVLKDDKPLLQDEESSVFEKRDNSANLVTIGILAIAFFSFYICSLTL